MGIEEIRLRKWSRFPWALAKAHGLLSGRRREYGLDDDILYRGHASTRWKLETTLERASRGGAWTTQSYAELVMGLRPEMEARTGRSFDGPEAWEVADFIATAEKRVKESGVSRQPHRVVLPAYDYMVYLRQMGFPSPLLDWTRSPYVAAFFALRNPQADRVAVYVYNETPHGSKGWVGGHPLVQTMFGGGRNHARHYQQQAAYTIAAHWDYKRTLWHLCGHEAVIGASHSPWKLGQDKCVRITLPASERAEAMTWLASANITAESLFQTEEAIVDSLATRVFLKPLETIGATPPADAVDAPEG